MINFTKKQHVYFFAAFLLLSNCFVFSDNRYPNWFFKPLYTDSVIVFGKSESDALVNASIIIAAYKKFVISGEFRLFSNSKWDDNSYRNTDYYYYFNQKDADLILEDLVIKEHFLLNIVSKEHAWLVCNSESDIEGEDDTLGTEPDWIQKISFRSHNRIYGVGRYTLQGRDADAWIKSEELAVFNMVTEKSIKLASLQEYQSSEDSLLKIDWVQLNYLVENVKVHERWIDNINNMAYVLVSAEEVGIQNVER